MDYLQLRRLKQGEVPDQTPPRYMNLFVDSDGVLKTRDPDGSIAAASFVLATTEEALEGTSELVVMSPARTAEVVNQVVEGEVVLASQAEAQAGSNNTKLMTPLRVAEAILSDVASQAEAQAGSNNTKLMTPLRVAEAILSDVASQAEAQAGSNNTKLMTPLRVGEAIVSSVCSQVEAEAGSNNVKLATPLRVRQAMAVRGDINILDVPGINNEGVACPEAFTAACVAAVSEGRCLFLPAGEYNFATGVGGAQHVVSGDFWMRGERGTVIRGRGNFSGELGEDIGVPVVFRSALGVAKTSTTSLVRGDTDIVVNNTSGLTEGDTLWLQLGTDPTDSNQPSLSRFATITNISGTTITFDPPLDETPSALTGGQLHEVYPVTAKCGRVLVENLTLDHFNLWAERIDEFVFRNLRIVESNWPFFPNYYRRGIVDNVTADLIRGSKLNGIYDYGWFFQGAWGSSMTEISNIDIRKLVACSAVSKESQPRKGRIRNISIAFYGSPHTSQVPVFSGYADVIPWQVENLNFTMIDETSQAIIGSTPSFAHSNLMIGGEQPSWPKLLGTWRGVKGAVTYGNVLFQERVCGQLRIDLSPSLTNATVTLPVAGLVTMLRVWVSTVTGITSWTLANDNAGGETGSFHASLVAGKSVDWNEATSILVSGRTPSDPCFVRYSTNGSLPVGAHAVMEYEVLAHPNASTMPSKPQLTNRISAFPTAQTLGTSYSAAAITQEVYDPGVYMAMCHVTINYSGATFASSPTLTLKVEAAPAGGGGSTVIEQSYILPVATTLTQTVLVVQFPVQIFYDFVGVSQSAPGYLSLGAKVSAAPSAGGVESLNGNIAFIRVG